MTEQEEFEFRLRLEKERAPSKSFGEKALDVVQPTVEALGAVGGGALGLASPIPGGTAIGAGLGYGIARTGMRGVREALGYQKPMNAMDNLTEGAKDVLVGGSMEAGGQIAVPALMKGASYVGGKLSNVLDLVRPSGPTNILNRYTTKAVGEKNLPAVINAARNVDDILPGGRPTLGQAVAGLPEGSPLQAMEAVTAKTAGGPSAAFGHRALDQQGAEEAAKAARTAASKVNYGKAFDPKLHKLKPDAELRAIAQNPYFQAAAPTAEKVASAKGLTPEENLTEILHTVKMGLDKKLNPGFGEIGIDNAERGAILDLKNQLTGWLVKNNPDYAVGRAEHAAASKAIKAFTDRIELAKNPLQPTSLQGGVNIGEETRVHLPNMLSRPMMIANAVTRALGHNVEAKIDAIATLRHLNPKEFASAMEKLTPAQQNALKQAIKSPGLSAATGNALAMEQ